MSEIFGKKGSYKFVSGAPLSDGRKTKKEIGMKKKLNPMGPTKMVKEAKIFNKVKILKEVKRRDDL